MNAQLDWQHPIGQIKFFDGWKYYRDLPFNPFLNIIVEIKEIVNTEEGFKMKDFGWCVVPIFHGDGYVINGHFQMPLFEGAFPATKIMKELQNQSPWEYIQQMLGQKSSFIKYRKDYTSILFRLIDGQRVGQLTQELDINTLDFKYLPQKLSLRTKYAFNQQIANQLATKTKLSKTVPNRGSPVDYNNKIVSFLVDVRDFLKVEIESFEIQA